MDPIEFAKLFNQSIIEQKQVDIEYRLYYNKETGKPLFYSMDAQTEGEDYINISKEQYDEGRYDLVVRNGTIENLIDAVSWSKLVPSDSGISCRADNVMIVDAEGDKKWALKTYHQKQ
jgi:hypothetical protein